MNIKRDTFLAEGCLGPYPSKYKVGDVYHMCHLELAGQGIEYSWGKAKLTFRRSNDYKSNDENFSKRLAYSLSVDILPLARVRRFARKSNDYKLQASLSDAGL